MSVDLRDARKSLEDTEWLTNVYPLYLHDLSKFGARYRLNGRGLWEPDFLPSWLKEDSDHPLIILESGEREGLALVNEAPSPHMQPGIDFRVSEFFVLRRYRRNGIGRRAAFALFDQFGGKWEIAELPSNTPAISFWRRVIQPVL